MSHLGVITIHLSVFIGLSRTGNQFWLSLAQNGTLSLNHNKEERNFKEMEMLEFESAVMEVKWPQQSSPRAKCMRRLENGSTETA